LSIQVEDEVIIALRRITRAIDLHSRGLLHECGMTVPQLAALRAAGRLQPVAISMLARAIHVSQATLTGILDRLERRGLVRRVRSGTDRRSIVVELTTEGMELLQSAPSLLQERFRRKLSELQEWERTQMLSTLQRIASMMEAEEIVTAPAPIPVAAPPGDVPRYLKDMLGQSEPAAGDGAGGSVEVAQAQ
jgi:DNA-binding MarR family transcriptional regulator